MSQKGGIPNWIASWHEGDQASLRGSLYPSTTAPDRDDSRLHPLATPPATRSRDPSGRSISTSVVFFSPTGRPDIEDPQLVEVMLHKPLKLHLDNLQLVLPTDETPQPAFPPLWPFSYDIFIPILTF